MSDIFVEPGKALQRIKSEHSLGKTVGVALLTAVLFAIAIPLFFINLSPSLAAPRPLGVVGPVLLAVAVFIFTFLGLLLTGFVTELVANALGGKGTYFSGLSAVSYSSFIAAVGFIIGTILSFIPFIGIAIAAIVMLIFLPLSIAVCYRAVKELFEMDMITAFVTVACITTGISAAIFFPMFLFLSLVSMPIRSLSTGTLIKPL
jgi:hypothetical protein